MFNIYDYHWVWYLLGFFVAPKIVLAVLVCQYLPVGLAWKIVLMVIAVLSGMEVKTK